LGSDWDCISYKQPKGVPHKFDPEKQAQFIEDYKRLKAELAEDETLLFIDAIHPTQAWLLLVCSF
jgi:hypothetical protein